MAFGLKSVRARALVDVTTIKLIIRTGRCGVVPFIMESTLFLRVALSAILRALAGTLVSCCATSQSALMYVFLFTPVESTVASQAYSHWLVNCFLSFHTRGLYQ